MPLKPAKPLTLARLAVAGSALMLAGCAFSFLPIRSAPEDCTCGRLLWNARLLFSFLPFVSGIALAWYANSLLGNGVRTERWHEAELDAVRRFSDARLFSVLQGVATFALLLLGAAWLFHHTRIGFLWGFVFAMNPITALRNSLRRPLKPGPRINWAQIKPIHSDHWGQPPSPA